MAVGTGHITESEVTHAYFGALATPGEAARVRRFLAGLQARGRRPATIGAYESDWRKLARWSRSVNGEPFDLSRMVGREAAEFRSHCLRLGQAPATVNRALIFLAEYARRAAEAGEVTPLLAEEVRKVSRVPQQALAPRGLARQELRRFLKEVDLRAGIRDRALIYLLLYTGLRLGEAARLRVEDITLSPRRGAVRIRSEWAKGGKERVVPIPAAARRILAEYLAIRGDGLGLLFRGQRGLLGRNGIARVVGKYARAAGVRLSPHTLRHCFSYRYLEQTANDLVGLAAILGHSNLNTTMGYTRKRMEDLEAAVEGLEFTQMAADRMRQLMATAQSNLRESGALLPVLLVEGAGESALVGFQEFGRTAEERQALFFAVGQRLAHMRPRRIVAVLDAYWKASDVELPLARSLADDPAAEECVVVVSLDKRGRSRLLVCPYERHPRLEGLEVEFKGVKEFSGGGEAYLLQAFFEGVAAAASKQGWREP